MTSIWEHMSNMSSSPSNRRKNLEKDIVPNSHQKWDRSDPEEEAVTPTKKKRIRDENNLIKPIEETPVERIDDHQVEINKAVPGNVYIHWFGMDSNNAVTDVTLADLLLLASSKGIVFKITAKGKPKWQNFPPEVERADESSRSGPEDNIMEETA